MIDAGLDRPDDALDMSFQNAEAPMIMNPEPQISRLTLLDDELQRLEQLSLEVLQDRWRKIYGRRAPSRLGAEF